MTDYDLRQAGHRVVGLLKKREFKKIKDEFGYALSYDRPVDQAIEEDLKRALNECGFSGEIESAKIEVEVSHFDPNSTQLQSLVECNLELSEGLGILVELIILESDQITLEDISSYQTSSRL